MPMTECIFMEVHPPPTPYQICKIEELRKVRVVGMVQCIDIYTHSLVLLIPLFWSQNSKGSVEVAAKCFYRRKDLPPNLLLAADRHASE